MGLMSHIGFILPVQLKKTLISVDEHLKKYRNNILYYMELGGLVCYVLCPDRAPSKPCWTNKKS